jgi:hypothetical protein
MCSINHDLKAVFIHVHKTGGTYLSYMLHKYYGFKNYYLHRPDHDTFCFNKKKTTKYLNYENRIHGVLTYYKTSPYINKKMGMTSQKWDTYYKFCFIRDPYDKIISAWNHINRFNIPFKNYLRLDKTCNDVEYMHMFMPQVRNIINEKGIININYIGYFETLENDFQEILKNIGIKNIIHEVEKKMNKREHNPFYEYYDQDVLDKVNFFLKEDFAKLGKYNMINNIDDFYKKYSSTESNNSCKSLENLLINELDINIFTDVLNGENLSEINNGIISLSKESVVETDLKELFSDYYNMTENNLLSTSFPNKIISSHNVPIVCTYVYYEKNIEYINNFKFFLKHAILDHVDYYIIINGKCTLNLDEYKNNKDNIYILYRENKGFDFGGYAFATNIFIKEYDYYFYINTSVLGPFMENYEKYNNNWTLPFIELFKENVKMVGTSINILTYNTVLNYNLEKLFKHKAPFTHVQSMFFCINKEYFKYLKNINFFNEIHINSIKDFSYIIYAYEIGLSQIALLKGWNINCILEKYKDLNYVTIKNDINSYSKNGDPYFTNSYFGKSIEKEDVIFWKNNRFNN